MMKNFYNIGAYQVDRKDFKLDVYYEDTGDPDPGTAANNPGRGRKRFLPASNPDQFSRQPLIRLLNLDELNVQGDLILPKLQIRWLAKIYLLQQTKNDLSTNSSTILRLSLRESIQNWIVFPFEENTALAFLMKFPWEHLISLQVRWRLPQVEKY